MRRCSTGPRPPPSANCGRSAPDPAPHARRGHNGRPACWRPTPPVRAGRDRGLPGRPARTGSELQRKTWLALRDIPRGETRSYGWLARHVGEPQAPRAIGAAVGRQPGPALVALPPRRGQRRLAPRLRRRPRDEVGAAGAGGRAATPARRLTPERESARRNSAGPINAAHPGTRKAPFRAPPVVSRSRTGWSGLVAPRSS
jgi:hypothetical protein